MILPRAVLADTSVWIDFLASGDEDFRAALEEGLVCTHPFVIGELACGNLKKRHEVLEAMRVLPAPPVASDDEVLSLIESRELMGRGIGYVDAHLLAATLIGGVRLWTRDARLAEVADELGVG